MYVESSVGSVSDSDVEKVGNEEKPREFKTVKPTEGQGTRVLHKNPGSRKRVQRTLWQKEQ